MKRVSVKGPGVKLNGNWRYKNEEEIITDEEYEIKKEHLNLLEDIENKQEKNIRKIEIVVEDETIDLEQLTQDVKNFVANYKNGGQDGQGDNDKNPDGQDNPDDKNGGQDGGKPVEPAKELEELKKKAKDLGVKVTKSMTKEEIIEAINKKETKE